MRSVVQSSPSLEATKTKFLIEDPSDAELIKSCSAEAV